MDTKKKKARLKGVRLLVFILLLGISQPAFSESYYKVIDLKGGIRTADLRECFLNNAGQVLFSLEALKEGTLQAYTYSREKGVNALGISGIESRFPRDKYRSASILSLNDQGIIIGKVVHKYKEWKSEPFAIYPQGPLFIRDVMGIWGDDLEFGNPIINKKGDIAVTGLDEYFFPTTVVMKIKGNCIKDHILALDFGLSRGDVGVKAINDRKQLVFEGPKGFVVYDLKTEAKSSVLVDDENVGRIKVCGFNNQGTVLGHMFFKESGVADQPDWCHFLYNAQQGVRRLPIVNEGFLKPVKSERLPSMNENGNFIDAFYDGFGGLYGFFYSSACVIRFDPMFLPIALNNNGEVLLEDISDHNPRIQCYLWSKANGVINLNEFITPSESFWRIRKVFRINDAGEVLALAYNEVDDDSHVVLLVPSEN